MNKEKRTSFIDEQKVKQKSEGSQFMMSNDTDKSKPNEKRKSRSRESDYDHTKKSNYGKDDSDDENYQNDYKRGRRSGGGRHN